MVSRTLEVGARPGQRVLEAGDPVDPHETLRKSVRLGLIGLGAFAVLFAIWAMLAPLSAAVVAQGVVKTDMNRRTVQHQEGGIIKEIKVRNGSVVKAGDPLVVLQDVRVDASAESLQIALASDQAKAERLEAERQMLAQFAFSPDLRKLTRDPRFGEILQREQNLFNTRRNALLTQINLLEQQIGQVGSEAQALRAQISADHTSISAMQEEVRINQALERQQFIDKARLLGLNRNLSDYQSRAAQSSAELARADQKRADLRLRIHSLRMEYMQQAAAELKEVTSKVLDDRERLRPVEDAAIRQVITAPVGGVVVDLKVNTIGGVVGPREPILDIVPEDAPMLVEARLPVDSINELVMDAPADVRLTAFDYRTTPRLRGKLTYVSADSLLDSQARDGQPYFLGHIEVSRDSLREAGDLKLKPGMAAEVFVEGRKRTALAYLFDPILKGMSRAMRER